MKVNILRVIRGDCDDGKTCPALAETDRDTYLVVGKVVTDPEALNAIKISAMEIGPGEQVVEVPASLLKG